MERRSQFLAFSDANFELNSDSRHLEAQLIKDSHRVEKGLALPRPKRPFGQDAVERLTVGLSDSASESNDVNTRVREEAVESLDGLLEWNSGEHLQPPSHLAPRATERPRSEWFDTALEMAESRRSIRNFSDETIDQAAIERVYSIACTTPSVCNRQGWALTVITEPGVRKAILELQNGNAGFGADAPMLCVVSVDLRLFCGSGERNQCWIDGGMFLMSVLLGFHAQGLGTCPLNWSVSNQRSDELRQIIGLHPYDEVVSLIAVGHHSADCRVARSSRRPFEEIIRFIP